MSMQVHQLKAMDPAWDEVLRDLRHDIYHTPRYVELEADRGDASCEAFLATENDKSFFVPYLIRPVTGGYEIPPIGADPTWGDVDVVPPLGIQECW